jgi:RND superfamily putative drug exporter
VLIDATIIRAVLLPASMKLLGDANWYLPSWLEWLPEIAHEPAPGTAVAVAAPTQGDLRIEIERRGPRTRVGLSGELDLGSIDTLRTCLEEAEAERPEVMLIDLRRLSFMDSTGLGEVIQAVHRGRRESRRVVLLKAPGPIERVLTLVRADDMMETTDDPAAVGFGTADDNQ